MRQLVHIGVRLAEKQGQSTEVRLRREAPIAAEAAGLALEMTSPRSGGILDQILRPFDLHYLVCARRGAGVRAAAVQDLVTSLLRDAGVALVVVASTGQKGAPQTLSLPCSWFRAERALDGRVIYVFPDRPLLQSRHADLA